MTTAFKKSLILTALLATTACGGVEEPAPPPGVPGTNGLPYAVDQDLTDAEGIEMTLAAATIRDGTAPEVIQGAKVTLDAGFFSADPFFGPLSGTIEIFGETVTFTNGTGNLPSNGQEVTIVYEPARSGTYAGAIEVISYGSDNPLQSEPIDGEAHYVFGFETDPAQLPSGSASYAGDFQASGLNAGSQAEFEGAISFEVNFTGDVTGSLTGTTLAGNVGPDLTLGSVPVVSNGFSGPLTCASGCTGGAGSVDATFYGPNAEELGGVISLDFGTFDGAGTFIITIAP